MDRAPAQVMTALEIRQDQLTAVPRPPHEATVRRVMETVDAAALDTAITAWLTARLHAQADTAPTSIPRHQRQHRWTIAVDGKALRGALSRDATRTLPILGLT
jgi:hypothetical protein